MTQGSRLIPVMLVIGVAGCAAVGRRNSDCSWPQEGHLAILDLGVVADRRHLANDALVAERFSDSICGWHEWASLGALPRERQLSCGPRRVHEQTLRDGWS